MRACFGLSEEQVSNQHDTVVKTFLKNHWHLIDEDGDNRNELKWLKIIKKLMPSKISLKFKRILECFSCDRVNRWNFSPQLLSLILLTLDLVSWLNNLLYESAYELYHFKPRKYSMFYFRTQSIFRTVWFVLYSWVSNTCYC